jgi:hypothetical protein
MKRPSHKELYNKIKQARNAVLENRIFVVNPVSVAADALELDCLVEDIPNILSDILEEIRPNDYAGQYPPQHSYEPQIMESELFAFKWESKRLRCKIYLKFALKERQMWLVSLHRDREATGEE